MRDEPESTPVQDCCEMSPFVMSCSGGGRSPPARVVAFSLSLYILVRWKSGKPAFGFPLFHPLRPSAPWECGNLACLWRDFQGARGKRGKPAVGFPRFPQPRHFHGALFLIVIAGCGPVASAWLFASAAPPPCR